MTTDNIIFEKNIENVGVMQIRPMDFEKDIDMVHKWVTSERGQFWLMQDNTLEMTKNTYQKLMEKKDYEVNLVLLDGKAFGLVELYNPFYEEFKQYYPWKEGDLGAHFLMAPFESRIVNFKGWVFRFGLEFLFSKENVLRMVGEPDVKNTKFVDLLTLGFGFTKLDVVQLADKNAQLLILAKEDYIKSHKQLS